MTELYDFMAGRYGELMDRIRGTGKLTDEDSALLEKACGEFTEKFRREHYHIISDAQ